MDLYHAREHDLGNLLAFILGGQHATWVAGRSDELGDGGIPALLSAARAFPLTGTKAEELDTALGYFETNAPRMRYKHFRSHGLFAGSAPSKQAARQSSGSASNSPACTGPSPAPPASSPCAASKPRPIGTDLAAPHNQAGVA